MLSYTVLHPRKRTRYAPARAVTSFSHFFSLWGVLVSDCSAHLREMRLALLSFLYEHARMHTDRRLPLYKHAYIHVHWYVHRSTLPQIEDL